MNYILIEGVDFCAVCHLVACYRPFKHGDSGIILTACRLERVVYVELCIAFVFLANLIQTSEVLPCVRHLLSNTSYLTQVLLLNVGCIGSHALSDFKNVRMMTSVLFKMADVNSGYLKVK